MASQTPTESPIVPGTVLASKYRVERIIGQGGMGVVVEARHIQLDDRVALKFLLAEYATHPEASQRFLREAQAARKIKSEHIAQVSDVGTLENGSPYMVMEFLEGCDLSKMLESGVLGVQDAIDYLIQGCEAIAEAHAVGIVHRDIKPANLFLTKRANGMPLVKVLDFGISKVGGNQVDNLTRTTASMGSALYMSPEQMQQTRSVDHRTDIYALGISLYELLAGRQPFYADTLPQLCAEIFTGVPTPIRELRPDIPEGLAQVLERAYARDRAQRFQTVGEFVVALAPWAPPRSQASIESIAKLTGLPVPIAGAPAPGGAAAPFPVPGAAPPPTGTQMMPAYAAGGTDPGRLSVPSAVPPIGGVPQTTGSGVSVVAAAPAPSSPSRGPMIAVALVGLLALGGGGAFFAMRGRAPAPAPAAPATAVAVAPTAPTPPAHPTAADPAPAPTATAAATPTAAPTTSASAAATAHGATHAAGTGAHHEPPGKAGPAKPPPAAGPRNTQDPAGF